MTPGFVDHVNELDQDPYEAANSSTLSQNAKFAGSPAAAGSSGISGPVESCEQVVYFLHAMDQLHYHPLAGMGNCHLG